MSAAVIREVLQALEKKGVTIRIVDSTLRYSPRHPVDSDPDLKSLLIEHREAIFSFLSGTDTFPPTHFAPSKSDEASAWRQRKDIVATVGPPTVFEGHRILRVEEGVQTTDAIPTLERAAQIFEGEVIPEGSPFLWWWERRLLCPFSPQTEEPEAAPEWDLPTAGLVKWFRSGERRSIPEGPFRLDCCRTVIDVQKFRAGILRDIEAGSRGPRNRYGALAADLRCLKRLSEREGQ